ncbi:MULTISPECIES: Flp pilus assembly protein CpaB [unclassified Phenylobacterium]|jgi:pilus assembly protein CpaB|uniref:Flp pilus assembly protein CpaB n=1 Tax=unclassified Phenylobacterium TaxID=2640670 RepID=UPI0009E913AF|nr:MULTISPECIES: Flp pilus assembly protein CpaB [unclassified Phenylobacterium]
MRVGTIVSLGASAALGLGALFVAKVALPARSNVAVAAAPAAVVSGVSVIVASKDIKYGERLDASHLKRVQVPRDAAPAGAFASVEQVLAQDNGGAPVALMPILAREALLPTKLSGPGARPSVAAEIGPGMRAYTIGVSDISGVGGHALPGDRVDVVLMRNLSDDNTRKVLQAEVVIQNVRVLGVDLNADPTSNKPEAPSTATLEVSVRDAQKLAVAADLGSLSLALRALGQAEVESAAPVGAREVVGGQAPAQAAAGAVRRRTPSTAGRSTITIVEGEGGAKSPGE